MLALFLLLVPAASAGRRLTDSTSWYKNGDSNKLPKRCDVKGYDKTLAMYACVASCGTGTTDDETVDVDALISEAAQTGTYSSCPKESMYWEHDPSVFSGYTGCVGQHVFYPCPQDGFDEDSMLEHKKPYFYDNETNTCIVTNSQMDNRTFWIIWGLPMDVSELVARTSMNPVVKFPLARQSYPSYSWQGIGEHGSADDLDALPNMKAWLEYVDAWTATELEDWGIVMDEGAEQGMVMAIAAKMLEMAATTCNRNFCQFVEAPAYGYSVSNSVLFTNLNKRFFFTDGCPDEADPEDVTLTRIGWFPGNAYPECVGYDNVSYAADSASSNSPWIETLVYPENPSGVLKSGVIPDPNRRICDGVYLYPMFFSTGAIVKPLPDCAAWAFSATKIYSASVRTGFYTYKLLPETNAQFMQEIGNDMTSLTYGDYSEWSWYGHMQINNMLMEKPYTDPTSWVGAYTEIQTEKWQAIVDGFENCPYIEVTNPYSGAYVWFRMLDPYLGLTDGYSEPTFFSTTMGVRATTYSFGFRGADPASYYGAGYGRYDFVRLQLFRDVDVYVEVGRRAAIVCGGGSIPGYITGAEWAAMSASRRRRLAEGPLDLAAHENLLAEAAPRLSPAQVSHHARLIHNSRLTHDRLEEECAPDYEQSCLFRYSNGRTGHDLHVPGN